MASATRQPASLVVLLAIAILPLWSLGVQAIASIQEGGFELFHSSAIRTAFRDSILGGLSAATVLTPLTIGTAIAIGLMSHHFRLLAAVGTGFTTLACCEPIYARLTSDLFRLFDFLPVHPPAFLSVTVHALWKSVPLLLVLFLTSLGSIKSRAEAAINAGQSWTKHALLFLPASLRSSICLTFLLLFSFSISAGGVGSTLDQHFRPLPGLIVARDRTYMGHAELNAASVLLALTALVVLVPSGLIRPVTAGAGELLEAPKRRDLKRPLLGSLLWPLSILPLLLPLLLIGYCFCIGASAVNIDSATSMQARPSWLFRTDLFVQQCVCALFAGIGALMVALPAALSTSRAKIPLSPWVLLLLCFPLLIPELSLAHALRLNLGATLGELDSDFVDSVALTVIAIVRSSPIVFLLCHYFLSVRGFRREDAAANLGAGAIRIWWTVTFRQMFPLMVLCAGIGAMMHSASYYIHSYLVGADTFTTWLVNSATNHASNVAWITQGLTLLIFYLLALLGTCATSRLLWLDVQPLDNARA